MQATCHDLDQPRALQPHTLEHDVLAAGSRPLLGASKMSKPRAVLTEIQAIDIFMLKPDMSRSTKSVTAAELARAYGVNEKSVRDIWKGRTWSRETSHLDSTRLLTLKHPGRPKGCKDTKPRKQRAAGRQIPVCGASAELGYQGPAAVARADCFEHQGGQDHATAHDHRAWFDDRHEPAPMSWVSIDAQLHQWAQGRISLHKLCDPFQNDWMLSFATHEKPISGIC